MDRYCPRCDSVKPESEFHRKGSGHQCYCKSCNRGYQSKTLPPVPVRANRPPRPAPNFDRFWQCVDRTNPDGCWPWMGKVDESGYGTCFGLGLPVTRLDSCKTGRSHRIAYGITNGAVPKGLVVRHLCGNRVCCNPIHLALGTHADNVRDTVLHRRRFRGGTYCRQGHLRTSENTVWRADGKRECRICRRAAKKARRKGVPTGRLPSKCCARGHPFTSETSYRRANGRMTCKVCAHKIPDQTAPLLDRDVSIGK